MKPFHVLRRFAIAVAAASLASMPLAQAVQAGEIVIDTKDGSRTAIVLPAGEGPRPTVIVLHAELMTAELAVHFSGFAGPATKAGFTAVFPQGHLLRWHDGRTGGLDGPGDVAFLRALIARLVADRTSLPSHIYIAGISNGGIMSFTMACRAGNLFRGIGTVLAAMPAGIEPCNPPPMPAVMINGTSDPLVPYDGGKAGPFGVAGVLWSVRQTAELFVRRNGCAVSDAQEVPARGSWDGTSVAEIRWKECSYHKPVTLYRINGGGHQIAGQPSHFSLFLGRGNRDISAAEAIISAFAREEASEGDL
jgi:polyhydroxybutyrate depolymerase